MTIFPKDPSILYAVIEIIKPYIPDGTEDEQDMHMKPVGEVIWGDVYKTTDAGNRWQKANPDSINVADKAPYSFNKIFIDPDDSDQIYVLSMTMPYSKDGGKTWDGIQWGESKILKNVFGDFRSMWIDPQDGTAYDDRQRRRIVRDFRSRATLHTSLPDSAGRSVSRFR